jgi:Protein of unknown function (DUF3309)
MFCAAAKRGFVKEGFVRYSWRYEELGNIFLFLALSTRLNRRRSVMLSTVLIIVLILLLIGALPTWPYSTGWGYYPGGGLGLILIIVVVLALAGRI